MPRAAANTAAPSPDPAAPSPDPAAFIARWQNSGAAERANYQLFLAELCDLLGVPRPDPTRPDDADNAYVFERSVTFQHPDGTTSTGRIDLYKRGCFVLEAKQGVEKAEPAEALAAATQAKAKAAKKGHAQRGSAAWDGAMLKARGQAEHYARALPATEGRPPLLVVVDVGHSLELYSEFTRTGGAYVPFPDPQSHRLRLDRLNEPAVRERLRLAWTEPAALDPAKRSARVTREIAQSLGRLAASLEKSGHGAEAVATFLMRALFTMFAEDVELLPKDSFVNLLKSLHGHPEQFVPMIEELWGRMKTGGFSTVLREKVRHFNGGLFEQATALPLTADQFELLIEASRADWRDVEPAIFGTLLERALNPLERHRLGAHYTPRAYVERLVVPTVVEPLRAEWEAAQAAALTLDRQGKTEEAAAEVQRFHRRLCEVRVLDPACGSGNFLYVTLEHLKRIEGEVLDGLHRLGHEQAALELAGFTVDPHQLLGLEVNPRAAAIAELVLWIGYLQWHFRTRGRVAPPEPIIKAFHNIECRDAVLAYDRTEPVRGDDGQPVTRWDGRTTKKHPVTGEDVPDETARVPLLSYVNPRPADWPPADFIVGNPPFIGTSRMRETLGDGYTEAVRTTYPAVPESADFVMYWWHKAALLVRAGQAARFGFITTNSLRQTFNRRVVEAHLAGSAGSVVREVLECGSPLPLSRARPKRQRTGALQDAGAPATHPSLSLLFAIPDHPWVDAADGAAVRIAMTVATAGEACGRLVEVVAESESAEDAANVTLVERNGLLHANLATGANVAAAESLEANRDMSNPGVKLHGAGFIVSREEALKLGLGRLPGIEAHIRKYRNGRDLTAASRDVMVIDLFGLRSEEVLERFPEVFQWVRERVKPERDHNSREGRRLNWWLFGETNPKLRRMLAGLRRYIATVETSKHRFFVFLEADVLPDNMLTAIATDDALHLGVLSSRIHVVWALATGGRLGVGNDPRYNKTRCFETFPFPTATEAQRTRIRDLAERLDAHRKRQQALHPKLTLTDCYNVLEKLRAADAGSRRRQEADHAAPESPPPHVGGYEVTTSEPSVGGAAVPRSPDSPSAPAAPTKDRAAEHHRPTLELTAKERLIHEQGLVSVLRELHDQLDAAVADAYGLPVTASDDTILTHLCALNAQRAAEEKAGKIRWLRPEFQMRNAECGMRNEQTALGLPAAPIPHSELRTPPSKAAWPKTLAAQVQAVEAALLAAPGPVTPATLAKVFTRAPVASVTEILDTLATLGRARRGDGGTYTR